MYNKCNWLLIQAAFHLLALFPFPFPFPLFLEVLNAKLVAAAPGNVSTIRESNWHSFSGGAHFSTWSRRKEFCITSWLPFLLFFTGHSVKKRGEIRVMGEFMLFRAARNQQLTVLTMPADIKVQPQLSLLLDIWRLPPPNGGGGSVSD